MAYEQKELSGVLFNNNRKTKELQPDYTGNALIGGVKYWVSGWTKESQCGMSFFSLAFKRQDSTEIKTEVAPKQENDEMPF